MSYVGGTRIHRKASKQDVELDFSYRMRMVIKLSGRVALLACQWKKQYFRYSLMISWRFGCPGRPDKLRKTDDTQ